MGRDAHRRRARDHPVPAGQPGHRRYIHRRPADHALRADLYLGIGEPIHAERSAAAVEDAALAGAADHRPRWLRHRPDPTEDWRSGDGRHSLRRWARLLLPLGPSAQRSLLERPGQPAARARKTRPPRPERLVRLRREAGHAISGSRWDFFPPGPSTPSPTWPASASATKP